MRARLDSITPAERARAAVRALELIARAGELDRHPRVACYAALPDELPTAELFEYLWSAGRPVYLPRIRGRLLEFAPITSEDDLAVGVLGIREPAERCAEVSLAQGDLALVPGLAFDRAGRRLGRGGGYYDRTFPPSAPAPRLIGMAFACQLVSTLPEEPHDRRVVGLLTEGEFTLTSAPAADRIR